VGTGKSNFKIITVTPTLNTDAYATGDVLFDGAVEIPDAVIGKGGCSKLLNMFVVDFGEETFDANFYFSSANTSLGSINTSANISPADIASLGLNGVAYQDIDQATSSYLDNATVNQILGLSGSGEAFSPTLIQAADDSTSVYCQAIISSGTPTFAVGDIRLIFHVQYR